jgi:hypothetical protein
MVTKYEWCCFYDIMIVLYGLMFLCDYGSYEDVIISHERIKIKRPRDFSPPPDIKINIRTPNISKTYQRIL